MCPGGVLMLKSSLKIAVAFGMLAITFAARPAAEYALTYLQVVLSTCDVFVFGNMAAAVSPDASDAQGPVAVGSNADFHDGSQGGVTVQGTITVNGTLVNAPT